MKKLIAVMLFGVLSLAVPVSIHAQSDNDAARIAMQKRNAKRSRKDVKASKHAMKKTHKSMGKSKRQGKPDDPTAAAGLPPA
ncbi:MAG TPA: hypothetical protein VIY53_00785 [Acidobacteriaceae bacterium]